MAVPIVEHPLRALYLRSLNCVRVGGAVPVEAYTGEPLSPLLPPMVLAKPASLMPVYVAIVLGGLLVAGLLIVVITLIRPAPADNATLISTAMTGLGVATLQALNYIKSSQGVVVATQNTDQIQTLHKSVNSGFEEFARLIRAEAHAAGVKESEEKQLDLASVEARITAAVDAAVLRTLAALPPAAPPAPPADVAPVDVVTIKPDAAQAIAAAVAPAAAQDALEQIADALPAPSKEATL